MARYEVGRRYQIRCFYCCVAKSQVRDSLRTRLLGIVNKVPLRIEIGILTNYLDAVLVRAHGAVRTETEEQCLRPAGFIQFEGRIDGQARVRDVVDDPDGKMVPG